MFSSHGHSHGEGSSCNHGHSHHNRTETVGFGDEDDDKFKPKPQMMMNPMMMAMMNAMKNNPNNNPNNNQTMNPMMMMMNQFQSNPQMMEMAKKMMEQRQQIMKEYMEKGGQANPAAMQELMLKAQQNFMAEFKQNLQNSAPTGQNSIPLTDIPLNENNKTESIINNNTNNNNSNSASDLLSANLNNSKLDDLINKRNVSKKFKEEQENKIMEAIAKKDYNELNAIKATQYGVLDRLKELIESGQTDPNLPDVENVYLLHWAAINNRLDIAKYLISLGVKIDSIGGELETTPLNWAARTGHANMCALLIQNGANPNENDIEGFSTLHLATMFGHSHVVAYLLVKGIDVDTLDKNGLTALMYAAQRVHSRDPAQLLITFNASINAQDPKGNTALHYCVAFNNTSVMDVLLNKGASLDIKNNKGQTPFELAIDRKKLNMAKYIQSFKDDKDTLPYVFRSLTRNKDLRIFMSRFYPFLLLFYFAYVLNSSINWIYKVFYFAFFYLISYVFKRLFFDRNVTKYIPMAIALAFITWLYVTWFVYFKEFVFDFSMYSLLFIVSTTFSWYNMYKCYKTDPGILKNNRDSMNKTIVQFVEQNEFGLDQLCTSCIIRKPLRSKHCAECDRCVAKFDHHCPWVDNCVGQANLKYFIGFLFWTPICLAYYLHGALVFYEDTCMANDIAKYPVMSSFRFFLQFMKCSTWVSFFTVIALFNFIWIAALCVCHVYQAVFIGLTTNERMNLKRYKHFYDSNGKYVNPFNFGIVQNFVDLIDSNIFCLKPSLVNWKKEHDIKDLLNSRLDKKKDKLLDV